MHEPAAFRAQNNHAKKEKKMQTFKHNYIVEKYVGRLGSSVHLHLSG